MDPTPDADLTDAIVERLARRHTTASVLFHHALADRLGLGPSDHKCLDLLRERDGMTSAELAALTGLTTGAITGVVARLERAGYVRRGPHPDDGRKQILTADPVRVAEVHEATEPLRSELRDVLDGFDAPQLAAVTEFLRRSTAIALRNATLLRAPAHAVA